MPVDFVPDSGVDFLPEGVDFKPEGPIQKLNRTAPAKLPFGTKAAETFNKLANYAPFALQESTNDLPTLATLSGVQAGPPQGRVAEIGNELLKQVTPFNVATMGMGAGLGLAKATPDIIRALLASVFTKQGFDTVKQVLGSQQDRAPQSLFDVITPPSGAIPESGAGDPFVNLHPVAPPPAAGQGQELAQLLLGAAAMGGGAATAIVPGAPAATGIKPVMTRLFPGEEMQTRGVPVAGQDFPHAGRPRVFFMPDVEQPKSFETPIIGQRPLTVGQPVITPELPQAVKEETLSCQIRKPVYKPSGLPEPQAPTFADIGKQGGQISFEGQGIPSAMQSQAMVPENLLKSPDQLSGKKFYTGINPEVLKPAIRVLGKLLIGQPGDTHADILERNGIDPKVIPHEDARRGFAYFNKQTGQYDFLSRTEAQNASGIFGTAKAGGLDSMDLPGAFNKQQLKGPNAIRELRADSLSETQPSGNLPKVEEEIRQGAGAQGEARQKTVQVENFFEEPDETAKAVVPIGAKAEVPEAKLKPTPEIAERIKESAVKSPVYHATSDEYERASSEIASSKVGHSSRFGMHFAQVPEQSQAIARRMSSGPVRTSAYFLDIRNPLRVSDEEANFVPSLVGKLESDGIMTPDEIQLFNKVKYNDQSKFLTDLLMRKGYDGLVYKNTGEIGRRHGWNDSYVPFRDTQIINAIAPKRAPTGELYSGASFKLTDQFIRDVLEKADPEKRTYLQALFNANAKNKEFVEALGLNQLFGTGKMTDELFDRLYDIPFKVRKDASDIVAVIRPDELKDAAAQEVKERFMEKDPARTKQWEKFQKDKGINPFYSGLPIPSLSKANIKNAIDVAKEGTRKVLNKFLGANVDKPLSETIDAMRYKHMEYSAPAHVAADERLASRMIEYAASDITSKITGASPAYKENVRKAWIDEGIKKGVYERPKPGTPSRIQPSIRIPELGNLYVRSDLAPEVMQVVKNRGPVPEGAAKMILNALTELQILGPTDFVFHMANMYSSIVKSAGKTSNYYTDLTARMPGVKHLDAIGRIGWNICKTMQNSPEVQAEMARISALGALRSDTPYPSLIGKATGGLLDPGKMIHIIDRAGRRARNQMFDNLVKQGLVKDTPLDRREFINKMGQYNSKLMSSRQEWMKNTFSPFVVAGKRFNRNAVESFMASPEFRAASPEAYAKTRLSNAIAQAATWIAVPIVLNAILTGKPFGRPGTPIGEIDTGKDDSSGRHITFDPAKTDLSRRGERNLGIQAVVEGTRRGEDKMTILQKAIKDVALGYWHPWEGPPMRFIEAGVGTYHATGDAGQAIKEALKAINPAVTAALMQNEKGQPGGIKAVGKQLAGSVGMTSVLPTHAEAVESVSGKPLEQMTLQERVDAEKAYRKERKMGVGDRAKNIGRAVEHDIRRGEDIAKEMSKADQNWFASRGLPVPGYDNALMVHGTRITLSLAEQKRLAGYVLEEYNKTLPILRKQYDDIPEQAQAKFFGGLMSRARALAHNRLLQEIMSSSKNESDNPGVGVRGLGKTRQ